MDPDFSGSDPDFRPIRTQEIKLDPDPVKKSDPKHRLNKLNCSSDIILDPKPEFLKSQ